MLAKLGIGNAHPGGFAATLEQLKAWPIPKGSHVLEVGCGTGRTACLLAKQGCHVTAVDNREDMLRKARQRADYEEVDVNFKLGDACHLPFEDKRFDTVFLESVTLFAGIEKSIPEYYRVLRDGGILYDREMLAEGSVSPELMEDLRQLYSFQKLPTKEEWIAYFKQQGFTHVQCWNPAKFDHTAQDEQLYPDYFQIPDELSFIDPGLWKTASRYRQVMEKYTEELGYGLFIASK